MNFAVLASGRGTNLQAIINAVKNRKIKAYLKLVVSDKKDAYALTRTRKAGIKNIFIDPAPFENREDFDREILKSMKNEKIDFVVLAGFMRILGPGLVAKYRNKIINIHPAILPCFKGAQAIKDAFDYGAKVTGVTVHFVDEKTDHGPIILQQAVKISPSDTLESLEAKIHKIEHRLYPRAVKLFVEGRLSLAGRQVKITAPEAPPAPPRGLK